MNFTSSKTITTEAGFFAGKNRQFACRRGTVFIMDSHAICNVFCTPFFSRR